MKALVRIGWPLVILLTLVTCIFAVGRIISIAENAASSEPVEMGAFDDRYHAHPLLSYLHIVPGFVFLAIGPLQFVPKIRARYINFHRWAGRVYLTSAILAILGSFGIAAIFPAFGGSVTVAGTFFFGALFLYCLIRAYICVRKGEITSHREWMARGFGVALGASIIRIYVLLFQLFTDVPQEKFFGAAFWMGFATGLVAAEAWLYLSSPRRRMTTSV